jgi:hypothetical protein
LAADADGSLELANFHFASIDEGSDFASNLVAVVSNVLQAVVIAVNFVVLNSFAFRAL